MAYYLATGRDSRGRKVTERVEAGSVDEAERALRDKGYDEIILHTDDIGARYTRLGAAAKVITPRQSLWIRDMPAPLAGLLIVALNTYRRSWYTYLAALGVLAYRAFHGMPRGPFDLFLILYVALPAFFALGASFFRGASGRYNRLMEAVSWGRWQEVLANADLVGGVMPAEEVAFQKAKALAGLGRLDEALRLVEPFSNGVAMPAVNYWSRLASVYSAGRHRDEAKSAMEKALELAPHNATILADIADSEVWLRRNPRRARELIARARDHVLSDKVQMFIIKTEGFIHLEEGRAREAREFLEQALRRAISFRHSSPLMGVIIDKIRAGLVLACAGEGDLEAARQYFQVARPRLVALRYDEQLARCEKAIAT
jgi:tetratricopeptide (TPR) repeat protein